MPNRFALCANYAALCPEVAVSIDLQLDPAVTENSFRDHSDGIHSVKLRGDDEGSRFVVGISSAGADRGDELFVAAQQIAIPLFIVLKKGNQRVTARDGAIKNDVGIETDQLTVAIAITITGSGTAFFDVAEDGTRVTADNVALSHGKLP